ncbi:cupin domain-containing protein [Aquisphaera insulae]|uniref:cupin domain-containing protein n=1 Tax=Aquisphaera insulae TaxID=2712864 RepID=UPI0013ED7B2F|nr:cupin domain-containing protein [Aquisphaera insulae]
MRRRRRLDFTRVLLTTLVVGLGTGWGYRELAHARERAGVLTSRTITVDQVPMKVYEDQGKPVGQIGLYTEGESPRTASLVTGRFVVDPGKSPHAPHVHEDEEVLIVASGVGEILCDGKATKVGPGSVMYSTPNVPHGINNTGAEPLTFYFIKWLPKGGGTTH